MPKIIDYTILIVEGPQDAKNVRDYIRRGWVPYQSVNSKDGSIYQTMVRYNTIEDELYTNYEAMVAWKQRAHAAEEKLRIQEFTGPCNFIFSTSMLVILICFVCYILM
jgi:hypothetical protein